MNTQDETQFMWTSQHKRIPICDYAKILAEKSEEAQWLASVIRETIKAANKTKRYDVVMKLYWRCGRLQECFLEQPIQDEFLNDAIAELFVYGDKIIKKTAH